MSASFISDLCFIKKANHIWVSIVMSMFGTLHREQPNCTSPSSNFWSYLHIYEFPKIINRLNRCISIMESEYCAVMFDVTVYIACYSD
jgi:hypothetical protein